MSKLLKNILHQFAGLSNTSRKSVPECHKIVFIRHGQSQWNKANVFCGWYDSPLTDQGREEAKRAGRTLRNLRMRFHHGFTSLLSRSIDTMDIMLAEMEQQEVPVDKTWRLNERHYGNLTGMNKNEAAELFGGEKVYAWRHSFAIRPPKILNVNPHYRGVMHTQGHMKGVSVPEHESLRDTLERCAPYWQEVITPQVRKGKTILIVAHENILRALVKMIEGISDEGIQYLRIPGGVPFMYILDGCMQASQEVEEAVRLISCDERKMDDFKRALGRAKHPEKCEDEQQSCKN